MCYLIGYLDERWGFWKLQAKYSSQELNPFMKELDKKINEINYKIDEIRENVNETK